MDFDRFRAQYDVHVNEVLAFSGTEQEFYLQAKAEQVERLITEYIGSTSEPCILDVGCGVGLIHRILGLRYSRLIGIDVAPATLTEAQRRQPTGRFARYDGRSLPFADETFDLTYTVNVLHHVLPSAWPTFVAELARVTRPGGLVAVFEHNPLNPITRFVVSRCEFDEDAVLLGQRKLRALLAETGLIECDHRNILFFPWSGQIWSTLERALAWLPFGAQHMVAARKNDRGGAS